MLPRQDIVLVHIGSSRGTGGNFPIRPGIPQADGLGLSNMKPPCDYSKDLRRKLAEGKSFDDALAELRAAGVSILDCIASVRKFYRCDLAEAKQLVQSSSAWSDVKAATDKFHDELSGGQNLDV